MSQRDGLGTMMGLPGSFLDWYWLALFPMFIIFFISALAETNRPPFDLVEAESELVAGFMVEYGSTPYMMFMLGEYVAICLMCALTTILFLGGWLPPVDVWFLNWVPGIIWFMLKSAMVFFMFAMVKAFVPRYRYDQLMRLGWKVFLPISHGLHGAVAETGGVGLMLTPFRSAGASQAGTFGVDDGSSVASRQIAVAARNSSAPSSCRCAISSRRRRR
jgi:NADH-quinone oxidoreductase subunit H